MLAQHVVDIGRITGHEKVVEKAVGGTVVNAFQRSPGDITRRGQFIIGEFLL